MGDDSERRIEPVGGARREQPPAIIDVHTHAFPDAIAGRALDALQTEKYRAYTDGTVADLLRHMDRAGVDAAVVCSIATAPKQTAPILEWSRSIASDRIVPFASVHPDGSDPYRETMEVARAELKGIKFHAQYQQRAVDDPSMRPIYRAAADHGLILLFHAGYDLAFPEDDRARPHRIAAVAREFPDLRIIAAHMGGWKDWDAVLHHLAGTGIYFDTSFAVAGGEDDIPADLLPRLLDAHGTDRLLFGTDSPWRLHSTELEAFAALPLNDEERRAVLGGNARALLCL